MSYELGLTLLQLPCGVLHSKLLIGGQQFRPAVDLEAHSPAGVEVAEHGLRQVMDGGGVLGPFQLPLRGAEVVEEIAQPQEVGLSETHQGLLVSRRGHQGTPPPRARRVPVPVRTRCPCFKVFPRKYFHRLY